jgi:hypothetical protein
VTERESGVHSSARSGATPRGRAYSRPRPTIGQTCVSGTDGVQRTWPRMKAHAGVAQLVEHQLPKLRVVGSNPIARFGRRADCRSLVGPPRGRAGTCEHGWTAAFPSACFALTPRSGASNPGSASSGLARRGLACRAGWGRRHVGSLRGGSGAVWQDSVDSARPVLTESKSRLQTLASQAGDRPGRSSLRSRYGRFSRRNDSRQAD